jgi:hypothetical protein
MPEWFGGSALNPDALMPQVDQWRLQWARVVRWRNRIAEIEAASIKRQLTLCDLDTFIAFLQNCYHLRDWICATHPELKGDVDELFKIHFELQGCRDVCNGFKHKDLKNASLDPAFNLYRVYDHCDAEVDSSANPIHWKVAFADGNDCRTYDIFNFAEHCFRIWEAFVQKIAVTTPFKPIVDE